MSQPWQPEREVPPALAGALIAAQFPALLAKIAGGGK